MCALENRQYIRDSRIDARENISFFEGNTAVLIALKRAFFTASYRPRTDNSYRNQSRKHSSATQSSIKTEACHS
ncbi:hypothetical protein PssB301D_04163 [Pseudomonas syringae pv. syringae str. B301D-R]|uniref:Uncharacterized protein n=1 Tax=Pseudomonas syringae pv. aceris TaxID=199198 RepID=A0A0P9JGA6_PSESX|nr:hypothetical protein PsyrB_01010 [Pseudomonas syringae pv. syringae B301D]EXL29576.1 hypothetical protein PssB301D_04163 [Pseudomonas syringae pv. syringae str. B301D-R]KPW23681.1 Uncharacterized protein ALO91_01154 [Pseudomonas syringae pv. aceris]